ncbi:DUF4163 domain-containing protein, partial [Lachnospiraceae bacterium OttesenSCG-928-D06]|nr:DUF4163 domain-containing protein [Lachnospiraceae bacterium OttesenSCG-928-D06]
CSCSNNRLPEGYTEVITDKAVLNNIKIEKHIITAEYQNEEGVFAYPEHSYLNASIKFPQLSNMENISIQEKINEQLKEVAMQSLNNRSTDETLKLFQDMTTNNENSVFWSGENEYNILCIGDEYISLNYEGSSFFGGAYPFHFSNYVTIGLDSGELIPFTEYFYKENIIEAIASFEFEWIAGQYTGGYTGKEPEVIEEFIATIKQMENRSTVNNIYDSASTYNFAVDEQFAYISFPFYDSLDGYVTLRFKLDILVLQFPQEIHCPNPIQKTLLV